MIRFEHVTKLYKTVIGVNDVSLDLASGAYGLLGPNGSGKTTFINLILGQLRPTIGSVRVFDQDPWQRGELLRRIGICPAVDILLPNVSALEWVQYLVRMYGFTAADAGRRAVAALETVGMQHAMRRPIGSYSLGMRQRCKVAQAIAHEPELLILDEPFNGLDPVGRHELTELFLRWIGERKSILLASHLLYEVEAVRASFLLISGGRLLASGSPQEVRSYARGLAQRDPCSRRSTQGACCAFMRSRIGRFGPHRHAAERSCRLDPPATCAGPASAGDLERRPL